MASQPPCGAAPAQGALGWPLPESCERLQGPLGGLVKLASLELALLPCVVGKAARDFPGCCKLESDFDLGAKFSANRKLK